MGMYTVLAIFFLFLVRREIEHGPETEAGVTMLLPNEHNLVVAGK
jgi:hypothetical protein